MPTEIPRIELSYVHRFQFRSVPQVVEAVAASATYTAVRRRITFRGRQLSREMWANAALWYFAELAPEIQEQILAPYIGRIEAIIASDGRVDTFALDHNHNRDRDRSPDEVAAGLSLDPKSGRRLPAPATATTEDHQKTG